MEWNEKRFYLVQIYRSMCQKILLLLINYNYNENLQFATIIN